MSVPFEMQPFEMHARPRPAPALTRPDELRELLGIPYTEEQIAAITAFRDAEAPARFEPARAGLMRRAR